MHDFTVHMMKIVGMPRTVTVNGRAVVPSILFSPALCEPMLFWQAASLSQKLHDEVLLSVRVVADREAISGTRLVNAESRFSLKNEQLGMGLASSLLLLSDVGTKIISPSRRHVNYDYAGAIFAFRDAVRREYKDGEELSPENVRLNTVFYDTIVRPARASTYLPTTTSPGVKR